MSEITDANKWLGSTPFVVASFAFAVVLMLHASIGAPFLDLDDDIHIRTALSSDWVTGNLDKTSAQPLTRFSYRVDYFLFHPSTAPAQPSDSLDVKALNGWAPAVRCMSGFYHLLAGIILWLLLPRIGATRGTAFLVAFLWVAHPCACETVCWISERKTVLTALFGFGAMLAWTVDKRRLWRLPLSYFLFLLAHLCKPSALGFLPLFGALEFLDADYTSLTWLSPRRWLTFARRLAIPVLLCAGALWIGLRTQGRELVDPPGGSVFTALLTDTEIVARYVVNTFAPIRLSFFYGVQPVISLADPRVWVYGVLLIAFFACCVWKTEHDQRRLSVFGIVWFFGALGPNSNLISSPYWMQDRYIYTAMPGLLLTGVLALRGILIGAKVERATLWRAGAAGAAAAMLLLAWRAEFFSDSETLRLDAAEKEPLSSEAQLSAARIFEKRFHELGRSGGHNEEQRMYGVAAAAKFESALKCPDLPNFEEPFSVKMKGADLLFQLGEYAAVRSALDGWLPPRSLTMLNVVRNDPNAPQKLFRRTFLRGYFPGTLAHAWALMAETSMKEAQAPEISNAQRLAVCQRAMEEAQKARAVWSQEDEAQIVVAKVLLLTAEIESSAGVSAEAQTHYDQALVMLHAISPESPNAAVVRFVLSHAHAPSNSGGNH